MPIRNINKKYFQSRGIIEKHTNGDEAYDFNESDISENTEEHSSEMWNALNRTFLPNNFIAKEHKYESGLVTISKEHKGPYQSSKMIIGQQNTRDKKHCVTPEKGSVRLTYRDGSMDKPETRTFQLIRHKNQKVSDTGLPTDETILDKIEKKEVTEDNEIKKDSEDEIFFETFRDKKPISQYSAKNETQDQNN